MPSSPLILLVHEMHESGIDLLREAGELRMASGTDPATLQREVVGAKALVIRTGGVIDARLMDKGKDLKVIGRHGVGYDQIDVAAATNRGIQVVYTPGANTQSVSEHVFALMIGLSKHFPRMMSELRGVTTRRGRAGRVERSPARPWESSASAASAAGSEKSPIWALG